MPSPFRIGVMQLTMEPLEEMLASARSSPVVSALLATETEQLAIGRA